MKFLDVLIKYFKLLAIQGILTFLSYFMFFTALIKTIDIIVFSVLILMGIIFVVLTLIQSIYIGINIVGDGVARGIEQKKLDV